MFRGQVVPANEVHDFHPPIADSGLFWTVPIQQGGLTISDDGSSMTLEMRNVDLIDQPKFPALDSIGTPARMSFKLVCKSTGEPVKYEDAYKHFRFTGFKAACQLEAQVEVPSIDFSWKSDPLSTSKCEFGIIGEEVNGRYYDGQ